MCENVNKLVLKSIFQLFEYDYYIPAYQRGYRWTSSQVKQLLDDIWGFAKNPPKNEIGNKEPFYCLQPIVVKENGDIGYEVIDGQQRLTTIYLILKHLKNQIDSTRKNLSKISYESRIKTADCIGSEELLRNIEDYPDRAEKNIDFYHMYNAYKTIGDWFQYMADNSGDATVRATIAPVLLSKTKVIWYEVEENEANNSIDIFTRLNIGKIPLTNSELIKALFLQKENFSDNIADLKQIQIAFEWDMIEKTLQDDSFWYFIYNPRTNHSKYENRIEYVFDLISNKNKDSEFYHTFNMFNEDLKEGKKHESKWLEVKKLFSLLDEWFNDYKLYHYIGFLIDCGVSVLDIIDNSNVTKRDFIKYLNKIIKYQVGYSLDELTYGDKNIRKILLLFNIQTILETQKSDMRFPFNRYKTEDWDIEHVCSQTDKKIYSNKRGEWIDDILDFFTGTSDLDKVQEYLDEYSANLEKISDPLKEEKLEACNSLKVLRAFDKIEDSVFDEVYDQVRKLFNENYQNEEKDDISNLALLDSRTNRSYGNAFFSIKRKRIISNDANGIFVPIATKNLFLKYYSKKSDNVMFWDEKDASDYRNAIESTLKDFLPKGDVE